MGIHFLLLLAAGTSTFGSLICPLLSRKRITSDSGIEVRPTPAAENLLYVTSETRLFKRDRDELVKVDAQGPDLCLRSRIHLMASAPELEIGVLSVVPNGKSRELAILSESALKSGNKDRWFVVCSVLTG